MAPLAQTVTSACLAIVGTIRTPVLFAKAMLAVPAAPLRAAQIVTALGAQLATLITASAQFRTARFVRTTINVTTIVTLSTSQKLQKKRISVPLGI